MAGERLEGPHDFGKEWKKWSGYRQSPDAMNPAQWKGCVFWSTR